MRVLLSIKPEYVEKIFSGEKIFEFRKTLFKRKGIKTVVIYATMPIGEVVGEFTIDSILEDNPYNIWLKTKEFAGITKAYFDDYYKEKDRAVAIGIGNVTVYNPPIQLKELGKNIFAPQSYRYLD